MELKNTWQRVVEWFSVPGRLKTSLIVLAIFVMFIPGVSRFVADRILDMLAPLIGPAIIILLLVLAFRKMLSPIYRIFFPKKKV